MMPCFRFLIFPAAYSTFSLNPIVTMSVVGVYRKAIADIVGRVFCRSRKKQEENVRAYSARNLEVVTHM